MNNKRILFTGGGTAGHVMVNLALIPYFQQKGWAIDYIGSKDGIERELIEAVEGVMYYPISTGKLRRYMSIENIKDPFRVLKGTLQSWKIIRKTKPNIIFSKGGFVSVPVIVAARFRRVPTIIHESDLTPGLANKIAAPFAKRILMTFPETAAYVPEKKAEYVGAIIRKDLFTGSKVQGFEVTKLRASKPVVLVMGGSIGSQKINTIIREILPNLLENYNIVHICGKNNIDPSLRQEGYAQFEYVTENLKHLFAITDFVISRAGANAIFEFLALHIPMLLIPLSLTASRGDQIDNAYSFENQGYAHVLEEEALSSTSLLQAIQHLERVAPIMKDKMKANKGSASQKSILRLIEQMAL